MKLLKTKFRRAMFRCFQGWYRDNQQRFSLPLRLVKRTEHAIELAVGDIPASVLTISLLNQATTSQGLDCAAYFLHDGECMDSMCWLSAYPQRQGEDVVCGECAREGHAERFPNTETLWREHVFEELLDWINGTLAPATHLDFYGKAGCTWVNLRATSAPLAPQFDWLASHEINSTLRKIQ